MDKQPPKFTGSISGPTMTADLRSGEVSWTEKFPPEEKLFAPQPERQPQGVVAILTGPDGYVWATAVDFEDYGSGCGFTLREAQEMQAKAALATELVRKAGNPTIFDAMEQGSRNILMDNLVRKKGFRVTIKPIGYEGSDGK